MLREPRHIYSVMTAHNGVEPSQVRVVIPCHDGGSTDLFCCSLYTGNDTYRQLAEKSVQHMIHMVCMGHTLEVRISVVIHFIAERLSWHAWPNSRSFDGRCCQ